jgi:hypothetical protein
MRPGFWTWAKDNLFSTLPDIGSNTKAELLSVFKDEGLHAFEQIGPDFMNWVLNRAGLAREFSAKLWAGNLFREPGTALFAADTMEATSHFQDAVDSTILAYYHDAAGNLNEARGYQARLWSGAMASNPIAAAVLGITEVDADVNEASGQRGLVCAATAADRVYTANGFGGGAWGLLAVGSGKHWRSIGSDRDTAGAAGTAGKWLIGDSGNGGAIQSVVYASVDDMTTFAVVAGFTALALGVGEQIRCIQHSTHPVGALGPDDLGNPTWMILTDTQVCYSADGVTWANVASPSAVVPTKKGCAYSRTSGRWVIPEDNGDIHYSDDNGATWTTIATALKGSVGASMQIKCDGYGTFMVVDDAGGYYWVSTDDGLTWTAFYHATPVAGWDTKELEVGMAEVNNWNEAGDFPTFFAVLFNDDAAPSLDTHRSLVY